MQSTVMTLNDQSSEPAMLLREHSARALVIRSATGSRGLVVAGAKVVLKRRVKLPHVMPEAEVVRYVFGVQVARVVAR
jgi:hypothetical protein